MESINKEDFFRQVALNSSVTDLDAVRKIYYGMVRTMSRELKGKQKIKLPDWGEFSLKIHKGRNFVDVNTGCIRQLSAKTVIKFIPDWKVKKHFHSFGEGGTMI